MTQFANVCVDMGSVYCKNVVAGQEKPHYVYLAPEYVYKAKHLIKAHKNDLKTCSRASNTLITNGVFRAPAISSADIE